MYKYFIEAGLKQRLDQNDGNKIVAQGLYLDNYARNIPVIPSEQYWMKSDGG